MQMQEAGKNWNEKRIQRRPECIFSVHFQLLINHQLIGLSKKEEEEKEVNLIAIKVLVLMTTRKMIWMKERKKFYYKRNWVIRDCLLIKKVFFFETGLFCGLSFTSTLLSFLSSTDLFEQFFQDEFLKRNAHTLCCMSKNTHLYR